MKIVADENIPYVSEAFKGLGEVIVMPGRSMAPEAVRDAELLLVRSITKVNEGLLGGSSVRFVATATIGEDHIDKEYLAERGIGFSSAPGCNANSVGQYMVAALLELEREHLKSLRKKKLGIVGVGNVGSRVLTKATALGMDCVLNDPPLARRIGDPRYRPLEEILDCDIVTLHVPLTREGQDATYHLADERFIRNLKPGTILINTSRGPVADGEAIKAAFDDGHLGACVLDVWEDEPNPDPDLVARTFIATPHIAGYSFDGKVNGTRQIYEAACGFLGREADWDPSPLLPQPECPEVVVDAAAESPIRDAVMAVYDIMADDRAMRGLLNVPREEKGAFFDNLRKSYPRRREFFNTVARIEGDAPPELANQLVGLGFCVEEPYMRIGAKDYD